MLMLMLLLHIAFVLVWSAALVYFAGMFAEHQRSTDALRREQLALLQRWIYAKVMTTSALASVLAGGWLVVERGFAGGWLPAKLALVLAMALFHGYCGHLMVELKHHGFRHRPLFYRALPLLPAALVLAVLWLVSGKPF